jgi:hypothetical protein
MRDTSQLSFGIESLCGAPMLDLIWRSIVWSWMAKCQRLLSQETRLTFLILQSFPFGIGFGISHLLIMRLRIRDLAPGGLDQSLMLAMCFVMLF